MASLRSTPTLHAPTLHALRSVALPILPLRFAQRLRPIELVVEFRIEVGSLETEHRAVRRHVNRKTAVAVPHVFAVGRRRRDRRFADGRHLRDHFTLLPPSAAL